MRVLISTAFIMTMLATGCTTAPGVIHGRTVELHQETATDGETLDAFVVRIAPRALEASKTARATVCGQVEQVAGRHTIKLKTDGFVSDCGLPRSGLPYLLVNGTAVDARENHFSLANRDRPGYLVTPWLVKYQDATGVRTVSSF